MLSRSNILFAGFALLSLIPGTAARADNGVCSDAANAVCVVQVGDRNQAIIQLDGTTSGGVIGGQQSSTLARFGAAGAAAPVGVPLLPSGAVLQRGDANRAFVAIEGAGNSFHVTQHGDRNSALQLVTGESNSVATIQGEGPLDSDNSATQVQLGSNNTSYIKQVGTGNGATLVQAPTAEAALLGLSADLNGSVLAAFASGRLGRADDNSVLLEQNGVGNEANLTQIGSNHSIALRQDGSAQISIVQVGFGKTISIEQSAGSTGVQIMQY